MNIVLFVFPLHVCCFTWREPADNKNYIADFYREFASRVSLTAKDALRNFEYTYREWQIHDKHKDAVLEQLTHLRKLITDFNSNIQSDQPICNSYNYYKDAVEIVKGFRLVYELSHVEDMQHAMENRLMQNLTDLYKYWRNKCGFYEEGGEITLLDYSNDGTDRGKYLSHQHDLIPCCWGVANVGSWERHSFWVPNHEYPITYSSILGIKNDGHFLTNGDWHFTWGATELRGWEKFSLQNPCKSNEQSEKVRINICDLVVIVSQRDLTYLHIGDNSRMSSSDRDNSYWVILNENGDFPVVPVLNQPLSKKLASIKRCHNRSKKG